MWGRLSAGTMSNLSDLPKVKDEPHVQREEGKKSHHKATKDTKVISSPRAWDHAEPRRISCASPKRSDRPHARWAVRQRRTLEIASFHAFSKRDLWCRLVM